MMYVFCHTLEGALQTLAGLPSIDSTYIKKHVLTKP